MTLWNRSWRYGIPRVKHLERQKYTRDTDENSVRNVKSAQFPVWNWLNMPVSFRNRGITLPSQFPPISFTLSPFSPQRLVSLPCSPPCWWTEIERSVISDSPTKWGLQIGTKKPKRDKFSELLAAHHGAPTPMSLFLGVKLSTRSTN